MKKAMIMASLMALSTVVAQAINLEVVFKDAETETVLKVISVEVGEDNLFSYEECGIKVMGAIAPDKSDSVNGNLDVFVFDVENDVYVHTIEKSFKANFEEDTYLDFEGCPQFEGIAVVVRATR